MAEERLEQKLTGRILIIDDDANIRTVLQRALTADGHQVDIASTGEEGLSHYYENAKSNPYDLILLDINLPGKKGTEVLREIKRYDRMSRVFLMTGEDYHNLAELIGDVGFDGFYRKPFEINRLRDDIKEIIKVTNEVRQRAELLAVSEADHRVVGSLVHDLNNSLGVVLGYVGLVNQAPNLATGDRADLAQIDTAARRATGIGRAISNIVTGHYKGKRDIEEALDDKWYKFNTGEKVIGEQTGQIRTVKIAHIDDDRTQLENVAATLSGVYNHNGELVKYQVESRFIRSKEDQDNTLQYARDNEVDLVLTDNKMPQRNGIQIMQELTGQQPKIAMLSSDVIVAGEVYKLGNRFFRKFDLGDAEKAKQFEAFVYTLTKQ